MVKIRKELRSYQRKKVERELKQRKRMIEERIKKFYFRIYIVNLV